MPIYLHYIVWAILVVVFLWIVKFFRYPERIISPDESQVLSPADGKIVAIEEVFEPEYFKDKRIQVSVFMSPNNVHVNWAPISGIIRFMK